jgi:hypothetical protein
MITFEPNDILFGRGPTYYNHPGNKRFRMVIKSYASIYRCDTPKMMKTAYIDKIWRELVAVGCRFLVRTSDEDSCWYVASDAVARKKISHALRDSRAQIFDKDLLEEKEEDGKKCNTIQTQERHKIQKALPESKINLNHFSQPILQRMQSQCCVSKCQSDNFVSCMSIDCMSCCLSWLNELPLKSLSSLIDIVDFENVSGNFIDDQDMPVGNA